jgi:Flp pilus assembly protein TadG
MRVRLVRPVRAAARDRRGMAAIEFGFVMGAIVVIVLGTYDVGNYVLQQMKLAEAAAVGGQFAVSYPTDTIGATNAINAALPSGWSGVHITGPTLSCACWSASGGQVAASCSATPVCSSGQVERFVTITLQRNYSPLLVNTLTSTSASYVAQVQ